MTAKDCWLAPASPWFPSCGTVVTMRAMKRMLRQRFIDPAPRVVAADGCALHGWLGSVHACGYADVN